MQCEGYTRHGGVFTLGPVTWRQCQNDAIVILEVGQKTIAKMPRCMDCWNEANERRIKILSVTPIKGNKIEEYCNET